jgi:hypothetical protein
MFEARQDVVFQAAGGSLDVELVCGEAQLGTYSLRLVDPDGVTVIRQTRGSFIDDIEDRFALPQPNSVNDGCELRCRARVWQVPPHDRFAVTMTLRQGGAVIGSVPLADRFTQTTEILELTLGLIAR